MKETTGSSDSIPRGFLAELRRRRVLPVTGAYIAIAWLVTEIADFFLEQAGAPPWSLRLLAIIFMVGFPVAAVLAWVIQVQPDGKRVLDSSKGQQKTVTGAITLGIVATAVLAWLILPRMEDAAVIPGYDPMPDSVAVLPFLDPDATPRERDIGDTLYTALTSGLYASEAYQVIQKKLPPDLLAFGRRVNVLTLLTGRVLSSGGSTQVEMALLDVASGKPRWVRRFDWDPTIVNQLSTKIANDVLQSLSLPAVSETRFTGTDSQKAYDAFLDGARAAWRQFNIEGFESAIPKFQQAIEFDPDYLAAHINLANVIHFRLMHGFTEGSRREELEILQKQSLENAERIDNQSPAVISLVGRWEITKGNYETAIQAFERALDIDPDHLSSLARYAFALSLIGSNLEKAEELWRRVIRQDPDRHAAHEELAQVLWNLGRKDEARAEMQVCIELEPEFAESYAYMAYWEIEDGHGDQALFYARKAYALDQRSGGLASVVANIYAQLGAKDEAQAWIEHALELAPHSLEVWENIYSVFWFLGEKEQAFAYVDRAIRLFPKIQKWQSVILLRDVETGHADLALQKFEERYPVLTGMEDPTINEKTFARVIRYAWIMIRADRQAQAQRLMERSLEFTEQLCDQERPDKPNGSAYQVCNWNRWKLHALLQQRDETLEGLRSLVVDEGVLWRFDRSFFSSLEFLQDDPEFKRLFQIIIDANNADMARVREMERNGEMPPSPLEARTTI